MRQSYLSSVWSCSIFHLLVDEWHHDSDVQGVLRRQVSLDHRLVVYLVPGSPEPGVLLVVQILRHGDLLPDPPDHLGVVVLGELVLF